MKDMTTSQEIDAIIAQYNDWRGVTLAQLRRVITKTNAHIAEDVKWKKPSKPEGVPVWTYNANNLCIADTLKSAVRLTFPKGAQLHDPKQLFNARTDSKTMRAIDFYEGSAIDTVALTSIISEALAQSE